MAFVGLSEEFGIVSKVSRLLGAVLSDTISALPNAIASELGEDTKTISTRIKVHRCQYPAPVSVS